MLHPDIKWLSINKFVIESAVFRSPSFAKFSFHDGFKERDFSRTFARLTWFESSFLTEASYSHFYRLTSLIFA